MYYVLSKGAQDPAEFDARLDLPLAGDPTPTPFTQEQEAADFAALYAQVNGGVPGAPVT